MKTISVQHPINLKVVRFELDFTQLITEDSKPERKQKTIRIPNIKHDRKQCKVPSPPRVKNSSAKKREAKDLVEELLDELYADQREWSSTSGFNFSHGSISAASFTSSQSNCGDQTDALERSYLEVLQIHDLREQMAEWTSKVQEAGDRLARYVKARDRLRRQQKRLCTAFTVLLRHITGESGARFSVAPVDEPGEGGYTEWLHAMRLVARLPAGVPQHFRKKLWLTLADRYLSARNIDWASAERSCFRGTAQPDDTELGAQILKDLHRTGCSLFCGTEGRENQAMLRRVLLAYARWNKEVGYCQGFNMLAAIILEVMDKSESDSLKVMIYLVEAVLPEGYFADDLRGLSADMAAFRDLLRLRLPRLANHMDHLQRISDGGGVEPPLPDVFTMQWFLTLYATWLPRESLLRIWDLILLDGNEILLLTALAIWDMLQDRILSARSADEFYSCMGGGAGAVWEAGEALVARVVAFGSAPELPRLRSLHRYRVTPPAPPNSAPVYQPPLHSAMQSMTKRGLRLFYSEDEGDSSDDGNKMALATVIPRREDRLGAGDRLSLDIGALKRQYARLRERQRQAHVILAAACARHAAVGVPTSPTSLTVNNLLLGKSAIVSSRGRRLGPPPGAVPPTRQTSTPRDNVEHRSRGHSNDTISWKEEKSRKSLSRRNSVKWRDIKKDKVLDKRKTSIDLDEAGDGIIVSELEANKLVASVRSRSSSESSSYSSHTASSTDTSLCDENERVSDSEPDLPNDDKKKDIIFQDNKLSPTALFKDSKMTCLPLSKESKIKHSTVYDINITSEVKPVTNISDYLDSAAGEPLRTYIDGFETKLKDTLVMNSKKDLFTPVCPFKNLSHTNELDCVKTNIPERLSRSQCKEHVAGSEPIRPTKLPKPPKHFAELSPIESTKTVASFKNITELSPIDLSPCNFGVDHDSPYDYNFQSHFKYPSAINENVITRAPDIIDTFTMYPNFVPDIDLTEKNVSDLESPLRSPGAESIVVSEDEPPIPLKIDKYFEHSPEFFGARVTDPNNAEIPNRRPVKRQSRLPKKPDSLTLQSNSKEKIINCDEERASSLPQSNSFRKINNSTAMKIPEIEESISPKEHILQSGRKNSERALQIIQENSKILSRILTKQNNSRLNKSHDEVTDSTSIIVQKQSICPEPEKVVESKLIESPLLKESTSDSIIGYRKKIVSEDYCDKNNFVRVRPISIDDPFSLESRNLTPRGDEFTVKSTKSPSSDCLGNNADLFGFENKGFLAKSNYKNVLGRPKSCYDYVYNHKDCDLYGSNDLSSKEIKSTPTSDWARQSFSNESNVSVSRPSTELKGISKKNSLERQFTSDDFNYPFSSNYNNFVLSKDSNICSETVDQGPKICENLSKTDNSQVSDFTHVVTSSISFTYEPSAEDDSPIGAKSNSSDTLCQIASLDQVSTPISPKLFPNRDTPTHPKDFIERGDKTIVDTDDTCSTITSLLETDTISSLSYPRSPSTGSFHPFPTRPPIRMPKELGVRLGMYPKDAVNSPPK